MQAAASLGIDGAPGPLRALQLEGQEGINQLSEWMVRAVCEEPLDLEALLRASAVLRLSDADDSALRTLPLRVWSAAHVRSDRDGLHYQFSLCPQERFLTLTSGYRVFQEKTVPEIVAESLRDAGVSDVQQIWRLEGTYQARPYVVQYDEELWSFIERLLAEEGINYWFDNKPGSEDPAPCILFGDAAGSHDSLEREQQLPFDDSGGLSALRCLSELTSYTQLAPNRAVVRDYDVQQPALPIEGAAGEGALEYYEYPARVPRNEAAGRAAIRLQQLTRDQHWAEGRSNCMRLAPGRQLEVLGADGLAEPELLVVEARHYWEQPAPSSGHSRPYFNRTRLAPAARAYRPPLPQRRRVAGVESAIVTGPPGEEIHVHASGEVKLRFPWDRSGVSDDKSSHWARTLNFGLGGGVLLPRVGWEVPVMYRDGNPDEPVVVGRLYNPETAPPYPLPSGQLTTSFQSATSPADGTSNELRMGDSAGSQELYLHASKDQTVTVGGDSTVEVSADDTHNIELESSLSVGGNQTRSIGGNQTVSVGTSHEVYISGDRSETITALDQTTIGANRDCLVDDSYQEVVGAAHGLQCNLELIHTNGLYTQMVVGATLHTAGLGITEEVLGARALTVGGNQTLTLKQTYDESLLAAKKLESGPSKLEADRNLLEQAGGKLELEVGGNASYEVSGTSSFVAPKIELTVEGKLDAKHLVMKGGTVHAKKATQIGEKIQRRGGTKIQ